MSLAAYHPPATLDRCFPYKVCINLDRRPERWQRMQARFAKVASGPVQRFAAHDGQALDMPATWEFSAGAYGCLQSHLAVLKWARTAALPHVLIFEDDVVFDPHFNAKFAGAMRHVPADWDMLFLGAGHLADPLPVAGQVVKLTRSYSAYAYALRASMYDAAIVILSMAYKQVDYHYMQLQAAYNCYGFWPNLAWVEAGYSDTQERSTTYWDLQASWVLAGTAVDHLLHRTVAVLSHHNPSAAWVRTRNLHFVLERYAQEMPGLTVLVVEQGDHPSLDPDALPVPCHYVFCRHPDPPSHRAVLTLSREHFATHKDFFVFADSDLYLQHWDLRVGLGLCQHYDCVSPIRTVVDLNAADTHTLLSGMRHFRLTGSRSRAKPHLWSDCCLITSSGMQRLDAEGEAIPSTAPAFSQYVQRRLNVYDSDGWARRLFPG